MQKNSGNFTDFFRPTKTTFCAYGGKNTDDDNNCCHDNFDQNFGNFYDNYEKNTEKPTNIVNFG